MKILVTGGCGYKGHILVPKLLSEGHEVVVLDTIWFGNFLKSHPNLKIVQGSVLDLDDFSLEGYNAVIHLSSIANDPCGDLNPVLTWETSALATMTLADKACRAGVEQFLYASSGSVYGVKKEDAVVEGLELKPISVYNKTKMISERVLMSYSGDMAIQILRPATVCGLSPRMRLDVSVNLLTLAALTKGEITVFGGTQTRPNVHIDDITDAYLFFLNHPEIVGIFNVGFENHTILDIAKLVTEFVPAEIKCTESNDPRSYRVDSTKLLSVGFKPTKSIRDAIEELVVAYNSGLLRDEKRFRNLEWMIEQGL